MFLEIIILISAIPVGLLISYLTKDELKQGRKWFLILMALSFLSAIYFMLTKNKTEALSSLFILIFTSVSYLVSLSKKFKYKL